MITNARVFDTTFVPGDIRHRSTQLSHLSNILQRAAEQDHGAENALLYGPTGAGKTLTAQYSIKKLREQYFDVTTQYVNCWEEHTPYKTLYRLLEGIDQAYDIHRQSTPMDVLLDRLRDYDDIPYIVVLDEVDQLSDTGLLYDLEAIPNLSMILITNREEDLFGRFNDRLTSRLTGCPRIHLDSYSLPELVSILDDRIRLGLRPDAITDEVVAVIADAAAGDARVAITTLRSAARMATDRNLDAITSDLVGEAVSEAQSEISETNEERLTPDQHVLLEVIREAGEIRPNDLYDDYGEQAADPKTDRTVRYYLTKMERYDLIEKLGQNRGRRYRAV